MAFVDRPKYERKKKVPVVPSGFGILPGASYLDKNSRHKFFFNGIKHPSLHAGIKAYDGLAGYNDHIIVQEHRPLLKLIGVFFLDDVLIEIDRQIDEPMSVHEKAFRDKKALMTESQLADMYAKLRANPSVAEAVAERFGIPRLSADIIRKHISNGGQSNNGKGEDGLGILLS